MVSCVESRGINLSGSLKRGNFYKIHILIYLITLILTSLSSDLSPHFVVQEQSLQKVL